MASGRRKFTVLPPRGRVGSGKRRVDGKPAVGRRPEEVSVAIDRLATGDINETRTVTGSTKSTLALA